MTCVCHTFLHARRRQVPLEEQRKTWSHRPTLTVWIRASEGKDTSLLKIPILPVEWEVEAILLSKNHVVAYTSTQETTKSSAFCLSNSKNILNSIVYSEKMPLNHPFFLLKKKKNLPRPSYFYSYIKASFVIGINKGTILMGLNNAFQLLMLTQILYGCVLSPTMGTRFPTWQRLYNLLW